MPIVRRGSIYRGMGQAMMAPPVGKAAPSGTPPCVPGLVTSTGGPCANPDGSLNAYYTGCGPYGISNCAQVKQTPGPPMPFNPAGGASFVAATAAQSNAPSSTVVGSQGFPAQSNAPGTTTAIPLAATVANGCFALFGPEPCLGPIGLYTLLAGAGGIFALMSLLGRHR